MPPKPTFFPTPADFRAWFEAHHDKFHELFVGFHKKNSGKPSITWPESVEVALCFGWIDGVRKSLDETGYTIRFTPRKPTSTWSSININLVRKLTKQGLMRPPVSKHLPRAAKENPASTRMNSERTPVSFANKKKSFVRTKPPGISSVPKPRGTKG